MTTKWPLLVLAATLCACSSDDDGSDATGASADAGLDATRLLDSGSVDAAPGPDASDAGADGDADVTACGDPSAPGASCVAGDPCTCSDEASESERATCVGTTWTCPGGYTRFDQCLGVPPAYPHDACEAYLDGGPFPGAHPDAGDAGDGGDSGSP